MSGYTLKTATQSLRPVAAFELDKSWQLLNASNGAQLYIKLCPVAPHRCVQLVVGKLKVASCGAYSSTHTKETLGELIQFLQAVRGTLED